MNSIFETLLNRPSLSAGLARRSVSLGAILVAVTLVQGACASGGGGGQSAGEAVSPAPAGGRSGGTATATPGAGGGRGGRGAGGGQWNGPMDSVRARQLYVSNRREDFRPGNYEAQRISKLRTDSIYEARSRGVLEFRKISYTNPEDGFVIPGYLFAPLNKPAGRSLRAMVWVHGGVHGTWDQNYWPFVREAVERGYVIITPEYRGSIGHSKEHYDAFDYGGKEVEDAMAAFNFLATLPYVDTSRVGIMGWSHGGFIAAHSVFRTSHPFKAAAAIVPVTNLFLRLARSGPGYQRDFAATIGGMTHERQDEYIRRSPVFHVANLKVPILVHVATNDCDVYFIENQQMVYTLQALKPTLAETKIYTDPPPGRAGCGHTFSRRVDPATLEREDTPEQIDSWNLTWNFFERHLRSN